MTTRLKKNRREEVTDSLQIKTLREKKKEQTFEDIFIIKKPEISGFKKKRPVYNVQHKVVSKGMTTIWREVNSF